MSGLELYDIIFLWRRVESKLTLPKSPCELSVPFPDSQREHLSSGFELDRPTCLTEMSLATRAVINNIGQRLEIEKARDQYQKRRRVESSTIGFASE